MADAVPLPTAIPSHATPDGGVQALDHVDQYLRLGQESDCSDVHLSVDSPPVWRRFGTLEPIWLQAAKLTSVDTDRLAMGFLTDAQKQLLAERGDVDFAYATDFGRFRASVVRHRLGVDLVFRIINSHVRSMDELGLPESLKLLTQYH
ncbi:MAG: type IV pili twitching motility protein PilT, partial [Chthoniobacteraceae bacterium]